MAKQIKQKSKHFAIFLLIAASMISGINTPVIKHALNTIPTPLFGFLRLSIPLVVLMPIMLLTKRKRVKLRYIGLALIFGLIVYFASNGLFYLGVKRSGAINAAIIGLLQPLLMFTVSVEVMREKFNARILLGILIAFGGSVLVVFGPLLQGKNLSFGGSLLGNLLLVGGVLCSVSGTWVAKVSLKYLDQMQLLFWSLIPGVLIYGCLSVGQWGQIPTIFRNADTAFAVGFGAIFNGLIAYVFSFYALKRIKGEEYGIFEYIDPAMAAIVAVIFFGEHFTPILLGGVVVIFSGLYLAEVRRHKIVHLHLHFLKGR